MATDHRPCFPAHPFPFISSTFSCAHNCLLLLQHSITFSSTDPAYRPLCYPDLYYVSPDTIYCSFFSSKKALTFELCLNLLLKLNKLNVTLQLLLIFLSFEPNYWGTKAERRLCEKVGETGDMHEVLNQVMRKQVSYPVRQQERWHRDGQSKHTVH